MDKVNSWSVELEQLRSIIVESGLKETTKWGGTVFTLNDKISSKLLDSKISLRFGFLREFK